MIRTASPVLLAAVLCTLALAAAAQSADPFMQPADTRIWKPAKDEPFLQEIGEQIPTKSPVADIAAAQGRVFALYEEGVCELIGSELKPVDGAPDKPLRLYAPDNTLWVTTEKGVHRLDGGKWRKMDDRHYLDMCVHRGAVHAATKENVFRLEGDAFVCIEPPGGYRSADITFTMEDGTQQMAEPQEFGPLSGICSYTGTLYGMRKRKLALFDGAAIVEEVADWGQLPSGNMRDMLAIGSRLFVATDRGLGVLRGMAFTPVQGRDGLPYEDLTCLAEGFEHDLWIGTSRGAIRMVDDAFQYFGLNVWLPGEKVSAIASAPRTVYIATDGGITVIRYEPYTLAKKAAYFERQLDLGGHKRLGFVHNLTYFRYDISKEKPELGWMREISDNDGSNSAKYMAAMSYKYALTGDEAARAEAVNTFEALCWLGEITGERGYIARSVWCPSGDRFSREEIGSGGLHAKWNKTPDGLWEWKGDTSSDEVSGHFYGMSVFHDLAARGREKTRAAAHLTRLMDCIIDNGWRLKDPDGTPTRWGRWEPDYLLKPYGFYGRGLNALEVASFIITAQEMSGGKQKYADALKQIEKWGYLDFIVRQRLTFPPEQVAQWDDRLSFQSYWPALRYEKDIHLRSILMRSLERTWEIKRMEQIPWFNFIYGSITGNDCEVRPSVQHLRDWRLELEECTYQNSHRTDLATPPGYVAYNGIGGRAISPRESEAKRVDRGALFLDHKPKYHQVMEPTGWLEDYWMGRYYGFILPPDPNTDPEATTLGPPTDDPKKRDTPYAGPPRPPINMDLTPDSE